MEKILVLDKVENLVDDKGNVIGRLVTDKAGNQLKVKKGKGGVAEKKWQQLDEGIDKAFSFKMGTYKDHPFVEDFEEVKDVFVAEAAKKVGDNQITSKNRAVALSYSKDLVVAGKIDIAQIILYANRFYRYMVGEGDVVKGPEPEMPPAEPEPSPLGEEGNGIDLDWLKESLKTLQGKGLKAWSNFNVLRNLEALGGKKAESVSEAVGNLSKQQKGEFVEKVIEALEEIHY